MTVQPLIGPLTSSTGPWTIALTAVLNLPAPTGALFTLLNVRFRINDPANGFFCLFTGSIGILITNGNPVAQLLPSTFTATPTAGDTCPRGLVLTKGPGTYSINPPLIVGP